MDLLPYCPKCNVDLGEPHKDGCEVTRCMLCGQLMWNECSCCCELAGVKHHCESPPEHWQAYNDAIASVGGPDLWMGYVHGTIECIAWGWYKRWDRKQRTWAQCDVTRRNAQPDLGRLETQATWDSGKRRWVRLRQVVLVVPVAPPVTQGAMTPKEREARRKAERKAYEATRQNGKASWKRSQG